VAVLLTTTAISSLIFETGDYNLQDFLIAAITGIPVLSF